MRHPLLALALAWSANTVFAQSPPSPIQSFPDAATIMARVAANQDQSETARSHYLYVQHARVTSRKGKTVRCEEITDTRVTPSESGSHQQLLKLDGRLLAKHSYMTYNQLPAAKESGDTNIEAHDRDLHLSIDTDGSTDRDLVENMRNNFTNDQSKDGVGAGLFPLTSKTQAGYSFHLLGRERMNGREVFHISFLPKDKDNFVWKGDAYIDSIAYQPVLVRTAMARKVPFAVRTLLGTSLPGLGFTVLYAPEPGGIWFPISFGTEFKLHVLFFFSREITISAENRDFEQTHVNSRIIPDPPLGPPGEKL